MNPKPNHTTRVSAVSAYLGLRLFPDRQDFSQWTGDDSKAFMKVWLFHLPLNCFSNDSGHYQYRFISQQSRALYQMIWLNVFMNLLSAAILHVAMPSLLQILMLLTNIWNDSISFKMYSSKQVFALQYHCLVNMH